MQPLRIVRASPFEFYSWFAHQSWQQPADTQQRSRRNLARNVREFCLRSISFILWGYLTCSKLFWNGTDGFTSPPMEAAMRILSPLKINRLLRGLNPPTLGPTASTITTRPTKATSSAYSYSSLREDLRCENESRDIIGWVEVGVTMNQVRQVPLFIPLFTDSYRLPFKSVLMFRHYARKMEGWEELKSLGMRSMWCVCVSVCDNWRGTDWGNNMCLHYLWFI
jgi:hypothetical protein